MILDNIHNHYEKLVFEEVLAQQPESIQTFLPQDPEAVLLEGLTYQSVSDDFLFLVEHSRFNFL